MFYLFNIHHPLEGKLKYIIHCWDEHAMKKIYGTNPIFIWDPDNKTNRPVPADQQNRNQQNAIDFWKIYPKFLKEIFIDSFTEGLHNPQKRITESQWQSTCIKLMNSIIYCNNPKCGYENFFDLNVSGIGAGQTCWKCQKTILVPPKLLINNDLIVLNNHVNIFQHHTNNDYNMETIIGKVVQKPKHPRQWGIKNMSSNNWTFIKPNGQSLLVEPGQALPLLKGAKINFGSKYIGEII